MTSSEQSGQPGKRLVEPEDRQRISEEIAAEVLKRAQEGDGPDYWLDWDDVKKE